MNPLLLMLLAGGAAVGIKKATGGRGLLDLLLGPKGRPAQASQSSTPSSAAQPMQVLNPLSDQPANVPVNQVKPGRGVETFTIGGTKYVCDPEKG